VGVPADCDRGWLLAGRRAMNWRDIDMDVMSILIGGLSVVGFAAFAVTLALGILVLVGETIEHFTY
jgi:hypothetical protein